MIVGLLTFLLLVCALILCGIILIQDSNTGGLSAAISGSDSGISGKSSNREVNRMTAVLSGAFLLLCLGVGVAEKSQKSSTSFLKGGEESTVSDPDAADADATGDDATGDDATGDDATGDANPLGTGTPLGDGDGGGATGLTPAGDGPIDIKVTTQPAGSEPSQDPEGESDPENATTQPSGN